MSDEECTYPKPGPHPVTMKFILVIFVNTRKKKKKNIIPIDVNDSNIYRVSYKFLINNGLHRGAPTNSRQVGQAPVEKC